MNDFRLTRPASPLPDEQAFGAREGAPDANHAWSNFGDLTLEQAYERFVTVPESFQEDFMWMGPQAFSYYFPVIDRYLREIHFEDEWDDCNASILGADVAFQFHWEGAQLRGDIVIEVADLADYVLGNLDQYASSESDQSAIRGQWGVVAEEVAKQQRMSEQDVDPNA